jgi:tetratricopeptide (TPR) repeat protein
MPYQEPDTALHHLKMAKSYLDDAERTGDISEHASQVVSESQLQALAKAAEHLNKARAIDSNEVLAVEDEKKGTKEKFDQDYLNGHVLLIEGVAHINSANHIWSYAKRSDGTIIRKSYREGVAYLEKARDVLEKALIYRPHSTEILKFLATAYHDLGDLANYRRILERHVELSPDEMGLHKNLRDLTEGYRPQPSFERPHFKLSLHGALTAMTIGGVALFILAAISRSGAPVGFGVVLLIIAFIGFWLKEKWERWFA